MFIAERQGFEPRVPRGTTVLSVESGAKVRIIFKSANNLTLFS